MAHLAPSGGELASLEKREQWGEGERIYVVPFGLLCLCRRKIDGFVRCLRIDADGLDDDDEDVGDDTPPVGRPRGID